MGLFLILAIIVIVISIYQYAALKERNEEAQRYYDMRESYITKGYDAETVEEAERILDTLETYYPEEHPSKDPYYHMDLQELREIAKDLRKEEKELAKEAREDWLEEAEYRYQDFYTFYDRVIHYDYDNVDKIKYNSQKCLEKWDRYFCMKPPDETIDAATYMQRQKTYDRDTMNNKAELSVTLNTCIDASGDMMARKLEAGKALRAALKKTGAMPRSDLLRTMIPGYTPDEVAQTYAWMKRTSRIQEYKQGNRYYVQLRTYKRTSKNSETSAT